jgi:DNA-binding transcriptional ArsR family regulator
MKDMKDIEQNAIQAAAFLKGLANPDRLVILCKLAEFGECSVSHLIDETGIAQTSMSQHLNKLKSEGIVTFRRDHRILYYSISHVAVREIMGVLYNNFCQTNEKEEKEIKNDHENS